MADAHRPPHLRLCAVAAIATLMTAGFATAQPVMSVRNIAPQQAVAAESEQWPIYYPRMAHRLGAAASTDEVLLRRLLDQHSAMRYDQATAVAVRIVELDPTKPEAHYNLACMLARLHQTDAALDALDRAVTNGWRDRNHLSVDPDLEIVRGDVRFGELMVQLESLVREANQAGPASDAETGSGPPPTGLPPYAIAAASQTPGEVRSNATPIILLVAEPAESSQISTEGPTRSTESDRRLITMALTPAFARRLSAWLASHETGPARTAPAVRSGGWIIPGADLPEQPARSAPTRSADATASAVTGESS